MYAIQATQEQLPDICNDRRLCLTSFLPDNEQCDDLAHPQLDAQKFILAFYRFLRHFMIGASCYERLCLVSWGKLLELRDVKDASIVNGNFNILEMCLKEQDQFPDILLEKC